MNKYISLIILVLTFTILSCDIIESDYRKQGNVGPVDTTKRVQRVLLEDFTGHTCVNCPDAHRIARDISELYPGQVIIMAVHVGETFAAPTPEHPYDFRCQTGNEIGDFFNATNAPLPIGMVNRIEVNTERLLQRYDWETEVSKLVTQKAPMSIELSASYNATNKSISVEADVEYFTAGTSNHYIAIYLLEDSIVSYQKSRPTDVEDYVHNHVLRTAINSTFGDQLSSKAIKPGDKFNKTFTYNIPADNSTPGMTYYWRPEKLRVVAIIHDNGGSYNVLHAAEAELDQ